MSQTTILVIDDSATIRKMTDSHLSQEGYRVVLAPTAEEGLVLADEIRPDLILLDHQLPGTTGIEVCRQLVEMDGVALIPVVVSSTLRKQAYIEYTDMPNVVDSLPKPYTAELLKTTVANAIANGGMIVASQSGGTAVPEVIDGNAEASLSGSLTQFDLREILDFLNNSQKNGMLEVETALDRVYFHLRDGRIQAVCSTSVSTDEIAAALPEKMKELGPLLKFTAGTGFSTQVNGLVELLDKKVLDPRMLKALLRHQAAVLTRHCFTEENVRSFSFEADREIPGLFAKSPLETSLTALLVDGAMALYEENDTDGSVAWVRCALRGQNLDRSGLDADHMKLLTYLEDPVTLAQLAERTGKDRANIVRVLTGFEMAAWIERREHRPTRQLIAMESERSGATLLRDLLNSDENDVSGRVVRDRLGLQLLLKRNRPDAVLLPMDDPAAFELARSSGGGDHPVRIIGISSCSETDADVTPDAVLTRPYTLDDVLAVVDQTLNEAASPVTADAV